MKNIGILLKKANTGRAKMESACGQIAIMLQPFFSAEISVGFQPSDGFVVIWEDGSFLAPNNLPVEEAVAAIQKDPLTFIV